MIKTTLNNHPELYSDVLELIEKGLNYQEKNSYEEDFAPLMSKENWNNCHILIHENKVVGHIGLRTVSLGDLDYSTPIALIGGIVISPSLQGQGLFKDFFKEVLSSYYNDVSFFLLWSDLSELYSKFNFIEFGLISQTGEEELEQMTGFTQGKLAELDQAQLDQIVKLYERNRQEYCTIHRNKQSWEELKAITSTSLYIKEECGNINDYFFKSKGEDLSGIIHEFSYTQSLKEKLSPYKTWLSGEVIGETQMYLGFIKIANSELFKKFIKDWSKKKLDIDSINEEMVIFNLDSETYELSVTEFIQGLWGPKKIEELSELGKNLFISGLDSI